MFVAHFSGFLLTVDFIPLTRNSFFIRHWIFSNLICIDNIVIWHKMQTKNIQIKNPIYRKSYNIINSVVVDTRWSWIEYRVAAQIFSQFLLKFIRNKPFIFIKYHHFKCVKRCAIFYTVAYEIVRHPIFHYGIAMEEEFFWTFFSMEKDATWRSS